MQTLKSDGRTSTTKITPLTVANRKESTLSIVSSTIITAIVCGAGNVAGSPAIPTTSAIGVGMRMHWQETWISPAHLIRCSMGCTHTIFVQWMTAGGGFCVVLLLVTIPLTATPVSGPTQDRSTYTTEWVSHESSLEQPASTTMRRSRPHAPKKKVPFRTDNY